LPASASVKVVSDFLVHADPEQVVVTGVFESLWRSETDKEGVNQSLFTTTELCCSSHLCSDQNVESIATRGGDALWLKPVKTGSTATGLVLAAQHSWVKFAAAIWYQATLYGASSAQQSISHITLNFK